MYRQKFDISHIYQMFVVIEYFIIWHFSINGKNYASGNSLLTHPVMCSCIIITVHPDCSEPIRMHEMSLPCNKLSYLLKLMCSMCLCCII